MNKTTVLILFGGMSNEHEVSLRSATSVIENIDRSTKDLHGKIVTVTAESQKDGMIFAKAI